MTTKRLRRRSCWPTTTTLRLLPLFWLLSAARARANVDYCATRLRFEVKDSTAVNEKAVKAAGAAGVIRPSKTACQVVIGPKVQFVYDELKKML